LGGEILHAFIGQAAAGSEQRPGAKACRKSLPKNMGFNKQGGGVQFPQHFARISMRLMVDVCLDSPFMGYTPTYSLVGSCGE